MVWAPELWIIWPHDMIPIIPITIRMGEKVWESYGILQIWSRFRLGNPQFDSLLYGNGSLVVHIRISVRWWTPMAVEIEELPSCSWISWFHPISTWTSIHQHESQTKNMQSKLERSSFTWPNWIHDQNADRFNHRFPKVQSWCESWSHGDVLMPCPVLRRRTAVDGG